MYVRNILSSGDFLTVVPLGIPVTLQYSDKGILEKVYYGYGQDKQNISDRILHTMLTVSTAPVKITVQGGTTWIQGVLYTSDRFNTPGLLPDCISDELISHYVSCPERFNFFAGNIESLATQFKGASPIRQWLSMANFNVLPGKLVPAVMDRSKFNQMFNTDGFPFKYPLITHYIIHNVSGVRFVNTGIHQNICQRVTRCVDSTGFINAELLMEDNSNKVVTSYTDVVKFNIHPNTLLVQDCESNIIYSTPTDNKKRDVRTYNLTCSFCGKKLSAPTNRLFSCDDIHCLSKLYPVVTHMLGTFNLPTLSYEKYLAYVKANKLTCISDTFLLDEYKDMNVKASLSTILRSIVPQSVIVRSEIFTIFTNRCNNSFETLLYYAHHPERLINDLDMSGPDSYRLVEWLCDVENIANLEELLDNPNITIVELNKKFEGAPIFRDKTIMVTGRFNHGDYSEISAILQSYSAKVTSEFSENVNCVIVGDLMENVNGSAIRKAHALSVPVYQEHVFFSTYEIDSDLRQNL